MMPALKTETDWCRRGRLLWWWTWFMQTVFFRLSISRKICKKIETCRRRTHPCSVSHSSPLLGYATQLMSGLRSDLAESSSGSTSAGEQQLTPTASSCCDLRATCTASVNRLPSDMHFPSCTKQESFWCADANNESTLLSLFCGNGYLTGEGEPGFRVWELSEQLNQSLRLFDTWDSFKGHEICCCQAFDLWPMPSFKLLGREKE